MKLGATPKMIKPIEQCVSPSQETMIGESQYLPATLAHPVVSCVRSAVWDTDCHHRQSPGRGAGAHPSPRLPLPGALKLCPGLF